VAGAGRGVADVASDVAGRRALVIDRLRHHAGDLVDLDDASTDAADRGDRLAGGALDLGDMRLDVLGGLAGLVGETLHFRGDHGKALAGIARTRRLDRRVEGEEVGLAGNILDEVHHLADPRRRLGEALDRRIAAVGIVDRLRRLARGLADLAANIAD